MQIEQYEKQMMEQEEETRIESQLPKTKKGKSFADNMLSMYGTKKQGKYVKKGNQFEGSLSIEDDQDTDEASKEPQPEIYIKRNIIALMSRCNTKSLVMEKLKRIRDSLQGGVNERIEPKINELQK